MPHPITQDESTVTAFSRDLGVEASGLVGLDFGLGPGLGPGLGLAGTQPAPLLSFSALLMCIRARAVEFVV